MGGSEVSGLLARSILIGEVKGLAPTDSNGAATLLGVGVPKNATSGKARLLQTQIGPHLQIVQLVASAGEDVNPPDGSTVAIIDCNGIKLGVATFDGIGPDPNLNQGEKEIYASDGSGNKLGRFKGKQNGKWYMGNASQNLRTQLDNLTTALNVFCGNAAQSAITSGGSSSSALAAAIVALMQPLFTAVTNVQTALDALLDTSP